MTSKLPKWPYFDNEEIEIVSKILNSGDVNYWTGSQGKTFEFEFSKYIGCKNSICLANGTLALYLAYKAIGLQNSDEFITTPRTFIATASTGVVLGAKPKFADVDRDSGCITAESIDPLITKKNKSNCCSSSRWMAS